MIKYLSLVCLVMLACDATQEQEPPDAAPDATVCTNAFDLRCMATNGCGVTGHFCCYDLNSPDGVVHSTCEKGDTCVQDICAMNP